MGKPPKKKKPKRKPSAYNKHIGREMRAGKTMKQAAASWKKKGSKSKSRASPKRSNPTGGNRRMPNSFNMNKIYSLANKVAFIAPYASIALNKSWTPETKVVMGIRYISGYNMWTNQWSFEDLKKGWLPYFATKTMTAIIPRISSFVKGLLK